MAEQTDKNRRRKAAIVTVVFHAIAIILFLIFGLKEPNPPLEEQGASIEFGWDEAASGDAVADIQEETQPQPEQVKNESPKETVEENPAEEVASDENSDIAVPDAKEKPEAKPKDPKPEPKPKPVEKPKPTPDKKLTNALESLNKLGGGGSQGDKEGEGDQGNPEGTTGKGALDGGSGNWQLKGRGIRPGFGTKITTTEEEGIVVINFWVDRNGNVTKAIESLAKPTNTTSATLIRMAKNDVLQNFKFNVDANADLSQRGQITYDFKLK